jgi:hypothetical protein
MEQQAENRSKKYEGMPFIEIAAKFKEVCDKVKVLTAEKAEAEKEKKFLAESLIPELMDDDGITNITLEDIGRVTLTSDVYARIPSAKKELAWAWLREHKLGDLITETINAGTLKSAVKKIIKDPEHEQLPEDLFSVTPFSRASITKIAVKK